MAYFEREGIRFHYVDEGEGAAFVFQHGLGGDVAQTTDVYTSQAGVRFVSMDCRGHGDTRPVGDVNDYTFDTFADDVVALMDQLGIEQAVVGGISMGAGISLNIALRYPARVGGLVLSRPAWLDQPMPANLWILTEVARYIRQYGAVEGLEVFKQSVAYQALLREAPDVAKSVVGQFTHPRAEETVVKLERMPNDAPCRDRAAWASIHVPTLVLGNHVDPMHPYEMAEVLAAGIPNARLRELTSKSVDKAQHVQEARQFIGAFLREVPQKS
ncbi:MAG: alpha/beta hydrolase [Chloroflexi bacterium]|nr:alpha/beta hydrolase [Chloroflexota bacterium]MCC6893958.1 alpha/beta hydrolase [Anaerolineae bacterium]